MSIPPSRSYSVGYCLFLGDGVKYQSLSRATCIHVRTSLQKQTPDGQLTTSAHPARFSPDDKFSAARVANKIRFGVLPTQQPPIDL